MAIPRISPEDLERLKEAIPIQRLAEARGIKLQLQGKDLIGLCPFHEEKTPSLKISPEKNLWHCFGCDAGGTVIDWVMKIEKVGFLNAVEILRDGHLPTTSKKRVRAYGAGRTKAKLAPVVSLYTIEDWEILNQVVDYYHETLKKSPQGLEYLERRGLKNLEMIKHFKIGHVNRTLGLRLPGGKGREGVAIRERLCRVGLVRETGHETFWGSIVIPIFDEDGRVTEIYGRRTEPKEKAGVPQHMYLAGPHKGVFNFKALRISKDVILCEAIIDALTFWSAGFRNVTASYGVNGFTPEYLEAFKKYGIKRVFIAYDRDSAGDSAAETLSEKLISEGFECFRIQFPHGMDANEYATKTSPPEKRLEAVIRNAVWMGKGKIPTEKRKAFEVPSIPEEEPTAATNEKIPDPEITSQPLSQAEETTAKPQAPETLSQPSEETKEVFPLEAQKAPAEPPTPEPARTAPVTQPVSPVPAAAVTGRNAEEIKITLNERLWRVRGLAKNLSYDQLKVNLCVYQGERFFVDTLDLYSARSRVGFIKQTAEELRLTEELVRIDLGKIILQLEEAQDKQIREALTPKEQKVTLSPEEYQDAMALLQDPNLLTRILEDFDKCGLVGEVTNKLVGYLGAISRKLDAPLGIIIQSSSAAGKTAVMESILAFVPEEEKVKYSAMTGQSLFYMSETNLKHKILAIVEEEGAERASYAIKLLLSEGVLTIASTGKDATSGKLVTHEYKVEGPVMVFVTTTNIEIDPELQNRCIMLTVDESREQTRAIHRLQRERRTLNGLIARKQKAKLLKLHQNAQRLLKPVYVVNPFAPELTFLDDRTRTRRDNEKYLSLIETITLIHQFQRPFKTGNEDGKPYQYLEVLPEDIELANKLTHEVLGHSLDELPPQTRRFILLIEEMVKKACERLKIERSDYRFYRRDLLDNIGWTYDQIRVHLERLVEFEYVLVHRGFQGQRFMYELLYDGKGKDGKPFCVGLIDVGAMKSDTTILTLGGKRKSLGGENGDFGGRLGAVWGGLGRGVVGQSNPDPKSVSSQISEISQKNAYMDPEAKKALQNEDRKNTSSLAANKKTFKGNGSGDTVQESE
ncbi:MAG: CHC2 zinc finger domain-containing protein [Candidatus Ozemobacteraceae bacterium]